MGFHRVLLVFNGFCWALVGFRGLNWALLGLSRRAFCGRLTWASGDSESDAGREDAHLDICRVLAEQFHEDDAPFQLCSQSVLTQPLSAHQAKCSEPIFFGKKNQESKSLTVKISLVTLVLLLN